MKKERNEFVMLLMWLGFSALKLALAIALLFGAVYVIGAAAEAFSGVLSFGWCMFALFALMGIMLYIDFRPETPSVHENSLSARESSAVRTSTSRL